MRFEERFDLAILERMKGYDGKPSTGLEQALGGFKAALQLSKLVVNRDAQCLEGPGCRINTRRAFADGCTDD